MIVDLGKLRDHATRRISQLAPIHEEPQAAATINGFRNLLRVLETVEVVARSVPTCYIDTGEARTVWVRNDAMTQVLLARHSPGRYVPLDAIQRWDDVQVHAAEAWANAMDRHAQHGLPLPSVPEHVAYWAVHGVHGK